MTESFETTVDAIAAGGDGVGRHDGIAVFVPRTAPGDVVAVEGRKEGRLIRGRLQSVIRPSADRVEPPCKHYVRDRCGGCQIQHLSYDAQVSAKSRIIGAAFARIARHPVEEPHVVPSDRQWRYRSKLTLAMRRRGEAWIAGLRRFDAPDEVFALDDCPITDEAAVGHWKEVLRHQHMLPRERELRGAVRLLPHGFAFTIEVARPWSTRDSAAFFAAIPAMSELWLVMGNGRRKLLHSRFEGSEAGASFVQVNSGVASALREWVLFLADARRPRSVVDAYAGTGELSRELASRGATVTAIEIDRDAARVAAARLPAGSRVLSQSVEGALAQTLPADLVILNPPRAGVHERVTEILNASSGGPQCIIYVSCNPATLARDVARLGRFRVQSIRAFDMFPQTAHVETVCELEPAA